MDSCCETECKISEKDEPWKSAGPLVHQTINISRSTLLSAVSMLFRWPDWGPEVFWRVVSRNFSINIYRSTVLSAVSMLFRPDWRPEVFWRVVSRNLNIYRSTVLSAVSMLFRPDWGSEVFWRVVSRNFSINIYRSTVLSAVSMLLRPDWRPEVFWRVVSRDFCSEARLYPEISPSTFTGLQYLVLSQCCFGPTEDLQYFLQHLQVYSTQCCLNAVSARLRIWGVLTSGIQKFLQHLQVYST